MLRSNPSPLAPIPALAQRFFYTALWMELAAYLEKSYSYGILWGQAE